MSALVAVRRHDFASGVHRAPLAEARGQPPGHAVMLRGARPHGSRSKSPALSATRVSPFANRGGAGRSGDPAIQEGDQNEKSCPKGEMVVPFLAGLVSVAAYSLCTEEAGVQFLHPAPHRG